MSERTVEANKFKLTGRVDRSRGLPGIGRKALVGGVALGNVALAVGVGRVEAVKDASAYEHILRHGGYIHRQVVGRRLGRALARNELAPCLVALVDDLSGVLLVLRLSLLGTSNRVVGLGAEGLQALSRRSAQSDVHGLTHEMWGTPP